MHSHAEIVQDGLQRYDGRLVKTIGDGVLATFAGPARGVDAARWILDTVNQRNIVARSQARADAARGSHALQRRMRAGSVAVYPLGAAVFLEAIVDIGDDPHDQVPLAGFRRIYTSPYYAIYADC